MEPINEFNPIYVDYISQLTTTKLDGYDTKAVIDMVKRFTDDLEKSYDNGNRVLIYKQRVFLKKILNLYTDFISFNDIVNIKRIINDGSYTTDDVEQLNHLREKFKLV